MILAASPDSRDHDAIAAIDQVFDIVMTSSGDRELFERGDSSSVHSPKISDPLSPQVRGVTSPDGKTIQEQYRRDLLLDDQQMFQERLSRYREENETNNNKRSHLPSSG
jgi:hypothetical protein